MNKTTRQSSQQGFILLTSYLLLSMLTIFSLGLFAKTSVFIQATERNKNKITAFNMAEAGLDLAITQLLTNSNYAGIGFTPLGTNGGYQVTVCPPTCGNGLTQPTNANVRLIQTVGYAPSNVATSTAYETRSIISYVNLGSTSAFDFSIFARDSISLTGNATTDSYDSRLGAYNAATAGSNGDIGSNTTAAAGVSLTGNARVKGDAVIGPNGNTATTITTTSNAVITGTKSAAQQVRNYTPASSSLQSSGSLTINGNTTLTLTTGVYRYDSLSISGNGRLTTTGAVTLYVDGQVSLSGNGVSTANNLPTNFVLNVTGNYNVSISGNGNFYGGIYAPNSQVTNTGNGQVFGAVTSKIYTQTGNGQVHYDEALKQVGTSGTGSVDLLSWQERNTSAA